ncbi:bile acid:sodium symporter family protein [Chryseolinea sp. T2]|uniref:bile acid:sodium symporter family protein n=1 Tax=Chryseolinea sp. T2 TaxID=3129255 RepID=UPI0030771930
METQPIDIDFSEGSIVVLNACLALIMFGVALDIKLEHFRQLRHDRKALFTGLFSQYLLLPIITVILIYIIQPPKDTALGMILVASCPGGNASNFFSMLSRGNLALSVTLSAFTSVFCFLLTPLSFFFWASLVPSLLIRVQSMDISFLELLANMVLILLIPLIAGMTFSHYLPKATALVSRWLRYISMIILIGFIVGGLLRNLDVFTNHILSIFWIVLVHNGLGLVCAYWLSARLGNTEAVNRSVAIETGIQNAGLGLILIFTFFDGNGPMALVAAWWGIWHLISGFTFALIMRRRPLSQAT